MSWTPLRAIDAALAPTHVLLGALSDPPRLNKDAGAAIEDPGNDVMFGAASSSAAAALTAKLPAHHRDPFDRLLIAQAITEPAVQPTKVPFIAGTDAHRASDNRNRALSAQTRRKAGGKTSSE